MPRVADHDQRRRQIAEAVWRIAAEHGLEMVTLRQVAAEAGVSVRLIQYYFGSRDRLLLDALDILNARADALARERIAALPGEPGPRTLIRAILAEFLPLDEQRRTAALVHVAYYNRFLREDALAESIRDTPPELENAVAALLESGRDLGQVQPGLDLALEADLLVNCASSVQSGILLGHYTIERAFTLIDYQLDKIFVDR